MKHTVLILRILLGLPFLVFGLNKLLGFMDPPELTGDGAAFMGALAETGYMLPLLAGVEVLAGALLLVGLFVPLALILLAPLVVNIVCYHWYLDPGPGLYVALALAGLEVLVAIAYARHFRGLFAFRARPE